MGAYGFKMTKFELKMAAPAQGWGEKADNNRKYSHPLHANSLLSQLNEGRKNPKLCDGILVIGGEEVPVQKNILSAACPYFRFEHFVTITKEKKNQSSYQI